MDGGTSRFRVLVFLGALAMIGSGFLPWWRSGGDSVSGVSVPAQEGIGLERNRAWLGREVEVLVELLRQEPPQLDPAGTGPAMPAMKPGFRPPAFRLSGGSQLPGHLHTVTDYSDSDISADIDWRPGERGSTDFCA